MTTTAYLCIAIWYSIVQTSLQLTCQEAKNAKFPSPNFQGTYPSPVILNTNQATLNLTNIRVSIVQPNLLAEYELINTGNGILMKTPPDDKQAYATGGLLGSDKYYVRRASYRWASSWDGSAGTIYDGEKFPIEVIALYQNSKYPDYIEAAKKPDGFIQLRFLDSCSDLAYDLIAEPFFTILENITSPGARAPITFGAALVWVSNVPAAVNSYFMPGTMDPLFIPESFEQPPTVIDVVISKLNGATLSCTLQFNTFFKVKNYQRQSYSNSLPPHPLGCRPVITGEPFLVIPT